LGKNITNDPNYTKRPYIIPNGHKIFQMVITYTNIYNLPKLGFLVWKQTIWQPWSNLTTHSFSLLGGGYQSTTAPRRGDSVDVFNFNRVTRLGGFSPLGWLFSLGSFCENYRSSPNN
jgi:hypothetical protein